MNLLTLGQYDRFCYTAYVTSSFRIGQKLQQGNSGLRKDCCHKSHVLIVNGHILNIAQFLQEVNTRTRLAGAFPGFSKIKSTLLAFIPKNLQQNHCI